MTTSPTPTTSRQEDEISLKDLILKIQDWVKFLLGKWLIILTVAILGSGIGLIYSFLKTPQYTAELTFVLEDSKSNPLGAYAGLVSQFGIDLGGSAGSGVFTGDNIIEFLKSRLMVEKTLLSPIKINSSVQTLADLYISTYNLKKKWGKQSSLKGISFPIGLEREKFSLLQDSILNVIYEDIVKKKLSVSKPDKKLSFISVTCTTQDEAFSKTFTERLVKEATGFYVQTKTMRSVANVNKLQEKADSIEALLNRTTYSAAATQDMNLNPARNLAGVTSELVTRDKMVLQTIYAEVIKNLEISRMAMIQEAPVIQIIDTPILPLEKERPGKIKCLLIGGFLGGLIIIMIFLFRKLYKDIMI